MTAAQIPRMVTRMNTRLSVQHRHLQQHDPVLGSLWIIAGAVPRRFITLLFSIADESGRISGVVDLARGSIVG